MMIEVQARMVREMHRLHSEFPGETIALVSHGDPIRTALLYFLHASLDMVPRVEIDPASFTIVRLGADEAQILGVNLKAPTSPSSFQKKPNKYHDQMKNKERNPNDC
jgi:broad specificity phosphatase PhoE